MADRRNPGDERFDDIESTLERLANSQRHLLTAQVLINDRLSRSETILAELAEATLKTQKDLQKLIEQVQILADGQKHTDQRIDALADIVRQLVERSNGKSGKR